MTAQVRQYLFALIFVGVGAYQIFVGDKLEASLYLLAGVTFTFNALATEPKLIAYKKQLAITTWVLIAATGILFFYLLQFKYL